MRVLFFGLLVAVASAAYIAPLYKSQEPIPGSYLIKIKDNIDIDQAATSLESLLSSDGRVVRRFKSVFHGLNARLNGRALGLVQRLEAVEYIEEDGVVKKQADLIWNLDRIDDRYLTETMNLKTDGSYNVSATGEGVTVYVLDTGINIYHEDIAGRASFGHDAVWRWPWQNERRDDCHGHGSHCAGTVGGTTHGVAKKVSLVAVRVLNCQGTGSTADIVDGINWVVNNVVKPAVISYSIGGSTSDAIETAFRDAINNGIICSVAAGNDDVNACTSSPARAKEVITVAATDRSDNRSIWTDTLASNWGDCVDLFAPGSDILSLHPTINNGLVYGGGTSMACPHVSGAAALILERNSTLTHSEVKAMILSGTTTDVVKDVKGSPNKLLYVQ